MKTSQKILSFVLALAFLMIFSVAVSAQDSSGSRGGGIAKVEYTNADQNKRLNSTKKITKDRVGNGLTVKNRDEKRINSGSVAIAIKNREIEGGD